METTLFRWQIPTICSGLCASPREFFEITTTIIGHDKEDTKQVKVLNRVIEVHEFGYTYEADARHYTRSSSSRGSISKKKEHVDTNI